MAIDVKLKPVSINFTLKDHIYEVLRESILKVDIYDADEELRLDEPGSPSSLASRVHRFAKR